MMTDSPHSRNSNPRKGCASRGQGDPYLGVATDDVVDSFRNWLWADYKSGAGIERVARAVPSARGGAGIDGR
jgi:hypothetical protein